MKKLACAIASVLFLASCGSEPVATITYEDEVITQDDGTTITQSPTPKATPTKSVKPIAQGAIVSCRTVEFIEKPAQDAIIDCLDGAQGFNVGAIKGPAIINVWGTWCTPCRDELPILVEYFEIKDPSIQLVGVDVEDAPYKVVQPFVVAHGITYPIFYDADRTTRSYFGMSVPVTWFIDSDNNVAFKKFGAFTSLKELQDTAKKYLGKS